MEFCFLTGGLLLAPLSAGRTACSVRGRWASSCSVFLSAGNFCAVFCRQVFLLVCFQLAASLLAKNEDIEYVRSSACKEWGI